MTEQKNLKRLVRARMAGTGESYTTARRHVLASAGRDRAAALPSGLVADYPQFGGGQHHPTTLLAHLLRQAGHRMPGTGEPFGEAMLTAHAAADPLGPGGRTAAAVAGASRSWTPGTPTKGRRRPRFPRSDLDSPLWPSGSTFCIRPGRTSRRP